jgi:nucleoside-diphosphate-sugar epimerase
VRPTSEVAFLQSIGVELVPGDLSDPPSLRRAVEGAEVVYHCAARVGDWGSWPQFQAQVIDATANLLAACRTASVGRLLHVSSIAVYGHPKPRAELFTEDEPLGQNLWWWDHYVRAKMAAEALVRGYPGDWTVVRPSWMYGPRDRTSLPRVIAAVEAGRAAVLGRGDNLLNLVYAADVAEGAVLAADSPVARGRAYHLSSEGDVAQRDLLDLLTDALGRPRVRWRWPYPLAFAAGFWSEAFARLTRQSRPSTATAWRCWAGRRASASNGPRRNSAGGRGRRRRRGCTGRWIGIEVISPRRLDKCVWSTRRWWGSIWSMDAYCSGERATPRAG